MRFGGYTEQILNINGNISKTEYFKKDDKIYAFVFHQIYLKSRILMIIISFQLIVIIIIVLVFMMGKKFFYIDNHNWFLIGHTYYQTEHNYFGKFDIDYEINNGKINYSIIEFEVFQILFDN